MKALKIITAVLCVFAMLFGMSACEGKKTPQTVDGFTKVMEESGFDVYDITAETDTDGKANAIIIAAEGGYQIEFWDFTDETVAHDAFHSAEHLFKEEHSVRKTSLSTEGKNNCYFDFVADGNFHMIARIDNTMLYCEASEENKDEIRELAETLGYK